MPLKDQEAFLVPPHTHTHTHPYLHSHHYFYPSTQIDKEFHLEPTWIGHIACENDMLINHESKLYVHA